MAAMCLIVERESGMTEPIPSYEENHVRMCRYDDSVVLHNANTTIGYARFSRADAKIEYIFVNSGFRRQGFGRKLVRLCEQECGMRMTPAPPLSPLGHLFFSAL
jgi:ribosomal protein S18 acetylase RimI-like enzyme